MSQTIDPVGSAMDQASSLLNQFHNWVGENGNLVGQGIYDMLMGERQGSFGNESSYGRQRADLLGGIDRDNNVLRNALGGAGEFTALAALEAGEAYLGGKLPELGGFARCEAKAGLRAAETGEVLKAPESWTMSYLRNGSDVLVPQVTSGIRNMMVSITKDSGNEVDLLRLTDGTRVLRMGGPNSVTLGPEVETIIVHTHRRAA